MTPDRHASTAVLLHLGGVIPLVFAATLVVCGLRLGNYDHLSRQVSELGAIGTPTRFLFGFGLVVCSILSVLFVVGLCRACRRHDISAIPVAPILAFSVSIGGAGLFPLPLRLHMLAGMPSVLLVLSPLLALVLWRNARRLPGMTWPSLLSFLIMSLGFLAFFPSVLSAYPGLKQRFFHAGWSIWFAYLTYRFVSLHDMDRREPTSV